MTEAQKRAKEKYRPKIKRLTIELYPTDADIIEHLEKQPKKQTYIKELVRDDINRKKVEGSAWHLFETAVQRYTKK